MSFKNYNFDGGTVSNNTIFLSGVTASEVYCTGGLTAASDIFMVLTSVDAGDDNTKVFTYEPTLKRLEVTNALAIGYHYIDNNTTLSALSTYNTNGYLVQTSPGNFSGRTITGTLNQITVTDGDGVSGNTIVSLPSTVSGITTLTVTNLNTSVTNISDVSFSNNMNYTITNVGASGTVLSEDDRIVFGTLSARGGSIITTLPTSPIQGTVMTFKRIDGTIYTWSLSGGGGNVINVNGVTGTHLMGTHTTIKFIYRSGTWYNIA